MIISYIEFDLFSFSGAEGNRTPVQKTFHRTSTIIVCYLSFPPSTGSRHPADFSSFMIRPYVQSLAYVVSHIVEAGFLNCEWSKADCCN